MPRIEVSFEVDGDRVVGHLHMPESRGPYPAVVVGGPMTSVKEQVTGVYAAALAARGLAALAIDHRHYGESEGEPRQYEHHARKVEDLVAALDFLATQREVAPARLGAVGVCLGCGYVAHAAARSTAVRSLGLVAGYYRDPQQMRAQDPHAFDAKVAQGRSARERYEATGDVDCIPAVALEGDAAMQTADTFDYYARRAVHPNYRNAFAVMSRELFLPFDVQAAAPAISVPVLMLHAEAALSPTWARRFYDRLTGPKRLEWLEAPSQTGFYDRADLVSEAADRLAAHLHSTLP